MTLVTTTEVLRALLPFDAQFGVRGDSYEGIEWLDTTYAIPSKEVFDAKKAELETEVPWQQLRVERNRRLAETDWVTLQALDKSIDGLGVQLPTLWMDYRQALRDLPANTVDPANPVWPTKPGGEE